MIGLVNRDDYISRYKSLCWGRWQTLDSLGIKGQSLGAEDGS